MEKENGKEKEKVLETEQEGPDKEEGVGVRPADVDQQQLKMILDIPLQVTVELGRTRMLVQDLLQLTQGSVVELSKMAGEPLEILVNRKPIARGEVVKVNEKFGVRITEILSPAERVELLG
jgi:flagellar motor switch protein FliN/FliY